MRIGIIGTGISGLSTADLLSAENEITLFEANDYIGGHTHTVEIDAPDGRHCIDTGFIVFNENHYPLFCRLLERLDVKSQTTEMTFSLRNDRTGLEYQGGTLNGLFSQRKNIFSPAFWSMIRDILRFNKIALQLLRQETSEDDETLQAFVQRHGFSQGFMENFLVPLGSSLWSSPPERFREFPIRFVVEFLGNHEMLQAFGRSRWRVIQGGSREYVKKLIAPFKERIRLNTPVQSVRRFEDRVEIRTGGNEPESFDQVVLATHADQSLRMLSDPSPLEEQTLSAFPYQPNDTVLHTDIRTLPKKKRAWAGWNYRVRKNNNQQAVATYNMNILQSLQTEETYCVTLNDTENLDTSRILGRYRYEHPQYTAGRAEAWKRQEELIGTNRTSFCGAYWGYGFHEDGVRSAVAVGRHFGREL
jgi:uncharacterized protein